MRTYRRNVRVSNVYYKSIKKPRREENNNLITINNDSLSIYKEQKTVSIIDESEYMELREINDSIIENETLWNETINSYNIFSQTYNRQRATGENFNLYLKVDVNKPEPIYLVLNFTYDNKDIQNTTIILKEKCAISYKTTDDRIIKSMPYIVIKRDSNDSITTAVEETNNPDNPVKILLDENNNDSNYKGIYLILSDIPFLSNIKWPFNKRVRIIGFKLEKL